MSSGRLPYDKEKELPLQEFLGGADFTFQRSKHSKEKHAFVLTYAYNYVLTY